MKFRNIDPNGALDVPALGLVDVGPGREIEASGELAESLLGQSDRWQHIPDPKRVQAGKKAAATRADENNDEDGGN